MPMSLRPDDRSRRSRSKSPGRAHSRSRSHSRSQHYDNPYANDYAAAEPAPDQGYGYEYSQPGQPYYA